MPLDSSVPDDTVVVVLDVVVTDAALDSGEKLDSKITLDCGIHPGIIAVTQHS